MTSSPPRLFGPFCFLIIVLDSFGLGFLCLLVLGFIVIIDDSAGALGGLEKKREKD